MKRAYKCILIGLIGGWLLAILYGHRVSGPGCRALIRIEEVKQIVEGIRTSPGIEDRIGPSNENMSKWQNPYAITLRKEQDGSYVIATPKYRTMYIFRPWERIMFLNFKKFEYPTIKEKVERPEHNKALGSDGPR